MVLGNELTQCSWITTATATTSVVVVATTSAVLWYFGRQRQQCDRKIPRNPSGIWETLDKIGGPNAHTFLLEESNRLGSLVYRIWLPINTSWYMVCDPYLARAILNDPATEDRPYVLYKAAKPLTAGVSSIFDSPTTSPHWKSVRKGTVPAFSSNEIERMKQICERHVERWIEKVLNPCSETGASFDPYREMIQIAFRVVCEAALEYPHVTDNEIAAFSKNVEIALIEFDRNDNANPLRQYLTWCLPERQRAFSACRGLHEFGYKILKHYYKQNNSNDDPNKQHNSVIRLLVNNPSLTTDRMKVAEIVIFLIAGHDTTGFSLAAALFHLAKYPEVHSKLLESVRAMEQDSNIQKSYLQWFIRESDRMLPVVAMGVARVTGREFVVPKPPISSSPAARHETGDMIVPKNALVILPQLVMNQSPLVFERPTEFDPLRWQDPEAMEKVMPFCAGPRNCAGQALAKTELTTVLSMLAPRFSFHLTEPGRVEYSFTLRFHGTRLTPHKVVDTPTTPPPTTQ